MASRRSPSRTTFDDLDAAAIEVEVVAGEETFHVAKGYAFKAGPIRVKARLKKDCDVEKAIEELQGVADRALHRAYETKLVQGPARVEKASRNAE